VPGAGRTPQGEFLRTHGEGVFPIGFAVDSVDDAEAQAAVLGLECCYVGAAPTGAASRTSTPTSRRA